MDLAPIVLFVYNRSWHTQQTVEALQRNKLAAQSNLIIYSDGPKSEDEVTKVGEVRNYIRQISGFKSLRILEKEGNSGLANSVIQGVTDVVNEYGKVIVLEDDLVTSPFFLQYMNDALIIYKDKKKVMHISGYNFPISLTDLYETFFYRSTSCWGWATWSDRWAIFEKDVDKTLKQFNLKDIYRFNLNGNIDFWSQVVANKQKKLNTWAIFWYAKVFLNNGLCLHPAVSLVTNIGHDGSGRHCGKDTQFDVQLANRLVTNFSINIEEDQFALREMINFNKKYSTPLMPQLKMIKSYLLGKIL